MGLYALLMRIGGIVPPYLPKKAISPYHDILLTGTFYSDNWIIPHLTPLAASKYCKRVRMVASNRVPSIAKVEAIYAPKWLSEAIGKIPARLLVFLWIAFRERPDIVGGFHILPNGLIAALTARFISAKSIYFCGGGPRELIGGGYRSGNRVFGKLKKPDQAIEQHLLNTLSSFNFIITMGSSAIKYFKLHADTSYHIVPGGFDEKRFYPANATCDIDLILIGRLSSIKRVDIFLKAISIARVSIPNILATVVGDGPDRSSLEHLADELDIKEIVRFVGHQDNVEEWLRRSKIFVLTSDSEGLSQAMIQAMLCGLPAIVSDVGDLGDLVNTGVNGYLVSNRTPEAFAEYFISILKDPDRLASYGKAAYETAAKYKMDNVVSLWNDIFLHEHDKIAERFAG